MMRKKILIVDDDPIFRNLLGKMLRVRDIEVIEADQGFQAAKIFERGKNEISLIVSDIQMPVLDGIALLKRVREVSPVPFILFTGLSQVMEAQEAHAIGANDFIMKPIDKDAIRKIVSAFEQAAPGALRELENRVPAPEEYRKIQLTDFMNHDTVQSDIYVRLSEFKFVKVARKGEQTPKERLKFYHDKKIDFLYVLTTEFGAYVEKAADLTKRAIRNPSVSPAAKLLVLEASTRLMAENVFLAPELDRDTLAWTESILEDTIEFASKDPSIFEQLTDLTKHSSHLYAQSLAVSLYASLVAREHGWTSTQTLSKVALGGLFHDIGKKELDPALLSKSRKNLTPDEVIMIESHCERGRDILMNVPGLPEEVIMIALHHHENRSGSGYPRRLRGEQINQLARLIHVVDKFVSFLIPSADDEKPCTPHEAIKKIVTFYEDEVDPVFLKNLMTVCNFPKEFPSKRRSAS